MPTLNAANNIAKVTNQQGAIPISLLNSHFHSSIGTSHSKTCIAVPALLGAAQHDNQVNTFSSHFLSHNRFHRRANTPLLMSQQSGWDKGLFSESIASKCMAKIAFVNTQHHCILIYSQARHLMTSIDLCGAQYKE